MVVSTLGTFRAEMQKQCRKSPMNVILGRSIISNVYNQKVNVRR
jgi:hypothetical protein